MTRPRLSLCLIVRDEAAMLPGFLEAADGLWDELCAVDTGSSDATVEILRAAGAKVSFRQWDNDFSAARNASLEMATGDWIGFFDPDERVSAGLITEIRLLLENPRVGAATVLMNNRLPHDHVRQARLLRLFRRDPKIHFQHSIHEDVSESVRASLERGGGQLIHLNGTVEHLGYERQHAVSKAKQGRDLALLQAHLLNSPLNLYSHFKLLEQCRFWGDATLWRQNSLAAKAALDQATPSDLRKAPFAGELAVLVAQGLYRADPPAQLRELERYGSRVVLSAALLFARGELHERLGHADEARQDYVRCLERRADLGDLQLSTVRPQMGLFRLALARSDLGGAKTHLDQALRFNGLDPEALLAAVALRQLTGDAAGVAEFVAGHRARHGPTEEMNTALREAALLRSESGDTQRTELTSAE